MLETKSPWEEGSGSEIFLRREARYWKSMHARALDRAEGAAERADHWESVAVDLEARVSELTGKNEALKARVVLLTQQIFGRKTEQQSDETSHGATEEPPRREGEKATDGAEPPTRRNRGQQRGAKGHGRRRRENLPVEIISHDLSEENRVCRTCGQPLKEFPQPSDSEEITWEVRVIRRIHRRKVYHSCGHCDCDRSLITAPGPVKVFPKGLFSSEFWARLMVEKFLWQRPLFRIIQSLSLEGLDAPQGTLTGGLKRIARTMILPLYGAILERARQTHHWHMDETRWLVFEDVEGKKGHRWWLWVVRTEQTCCFLMEPTRSAEVLERFLPDSARGIINADRYCVYQTLKPNVEIAFCWSHVRRDFLRVEKGYRFLKPWAGHWIEQIGGLFQINRRRLAYPPHGSGFQQEQKQLQDRLDEMARDRDQGLDQGNLHLAQRKVLKSLKRHWDGLTLFVDHPEVPMDNNESERRLRNPVVGRKNYYGSGAVWSGTLAAALFTLFQTLLIHHLHPEKFLVTYLDACGMNRGSVPPDWDRFLPWNASQEHQAQWALPPKPP